MRNEPASAPRSCGCAIASVNDTSVAERSEATEVSLTLLVPVVMAIAHWGGGRAQQIATREHSAPK